MTNSEVAEGARVLVERANAYFSAGRFEDAAAAYGEAAALMPNSKQARRNQARALFMGGNVSDTEKIILAELEREKRGDLYEILGAVRQMQGRYQEAIDAADAALSLSPGAFSVRHNRAVALDRIGRTDEAVTEFEALAKDGHLTADLFLNWGMALKAARRSCVEPLQEGLRLFPTDTRLHLKLAETRWSQGEPADRFASHMADVLAASPDAVGVRDLYASMLTRAEAFAEAEATLREGLALDPYNEVLLCQLSSLLETVDRNAEAAMVLAPVLRRAPTVNAMMRAGVAMLRAGNQQDAHTILSRAKEMVVPPPHITLAHFAMAARVVGDPEYDRLYDYNRFVRAIDLSPPAGYTSTEAFNENLAVSLERLHNSTQFPITQTARGGTQTDRDLGQSTDPVIKAFLAQALDAAQTFSNSLPKDSDHPFLRLAQSRVKFAGAWSIRLRAHGHHVNHVHPSGWISSAYYVRLPNLNASTGRAGWLKFGEPLRPVAGCTPAHWIEPKVGRLALFPSYMWHGVEPFVAEGDRLTVAFDIMPA